MTRYIAHAGPDGKFTGFCVDTPNNRKIVMANRKDHIFVEFEGPVYDTEPDTDEEYEKRFFLLKDMAISAVTLKH